MSQSGRRTMMKNLAVSPLVAQAITEGVVAFPSAGDAESREPHNEGRDCSDTAEENMAYCATRDRRDDNMSGILQNINPRSVIQMSYGNPRNKGRLAITKQRNQIGAERVETLMYRVISHTGSEKFSGQKDERRSQVTLSGVDRGDTVSVAILTESNYGAMVEAEVSGTGELVTKHGTTFTPDDWQGLSGR